MEWGNDCKWLTSHHGCDDWSWSWKERKGGSGLNAKHPSELQFMTSFPQSASHFESFVSSQGVPTIIPHEASITRDLVFISHVADRPPSLPLDESTLKYIGANVPSYGIIWLRNRIRRLIYSGHTSDWLPGPPLKWVSPPYDNYVASTGFRMI